MLTKRFRLRLTWQQNVPIEPTVCFVQHPEGDWCKAKHVAVLERRLEAFASPSVLTRIWHWFVGRRMPALE